jgi:hypothetical protein
VKLSGLNAKDIANREAAAQRAEELRPVLAELSGMNDRAISRALNGRNVKTPTSAPWSPVTVRRVLDRLLARRHRRPPLVRLYLAFL